MTKEEWKDIPNYEGLYQASNLGRIRSLYSNKNKIMRIQTTGNYNHIILTKDGYAKNYSIHKLVALAFIPNPNNLLEINHKDENPRNNNVNNLEWCNHSYNIKYGNRIQKVKDKVSVKIDQYDLDGNYIKTWNCLNDAVRYYKNNHIWHVRLQR